MNMGRPRVDPRMQQRGPQIRINHRIRVPEVRVVGAGAIVKDAGMQGAYFVEKGGSVFHTGGSCLYFVKNGGMLAGTGGRGFVVREPQADASLDRARGSNHNDREVESLSLSVVPATFTIVPCCPSASSRMKAIERVTRY
jgi:hypothetical protein